MAGSRIAWGIDVGNRALKAVRLVREGDGFRVDDFDIIEHATPLSQAGDNRDELVAKALAEFVGRHKTGAAPVGIAVSGSQSFAKFVKLPPVEEKEIPKIVRFEAIQQIPFPLDDVEWQYQLFRKADDPEIEVGIFAMRKELVDRIVSTYTDVNLNVQNVQTSPLAVYNALAFDGKLDGGTTLIIDMGAESTDLIIADGGQVWLRSLPIGGNNFTETLVRGFKLDFAKAEEMKRDASSSKYARQIFQAMRPVFADLVGEIQRSVGFYSSTHAGTKIAKAIVLGGTFKLPGLKKYLQQNLQMDVEEVKQFTAAGPTDPKTLATFQDNILSAVTAYGLAAQTMGEGKIVSSLLPGRIRKERVWREKTKWFVAASGLFVLGAGIAVAGGLLPKMAYEQHDAERDKVNQIADRAQKLDASWSSVEGAGESERTLIKNVRSLEENRDLWPKIVATIRSSLPHEDPAKLKALPRDQREEIKLDRWESIYFSDIGGLLNDTRRARFITEQPVVVAPAGGDASAGQVVQKFFMPQAPQMFVGMMGSGQGQGDEAAPPPDWVKTAAAGKPGFVIRIAGTTPYREAYSLIERTVTSNLLKTREGREGVKTDFYVADVLVARTPTKLGEDPARVTEMTAAYQRAQALKNGTLAQGSAAPTGYGNFGGGGGPAMDVSPDDRGGMNPGMAMGGNNNPANDPTPFYEPGTTEDRRQDKEFALLVFVVIGQAPVMPAATADGGTAAPAPAAPAVPAAPAAPATPAGMPPGMPAGGMPMGMPPGAVPPRNPPGR